MPSVDQATLEATRRFLHGVAELLLAGPQYRASGTIRLRVLPDGFGTVASPDVRVDEDVLVHGDDRVRLAGRTIASVGTAAGLEPASLDEVYSDGSGLTPEDLVEVDAAAAGVLAQALVAGDTALRRLAPDHTPVLWPEHFDVAVTLAEVNYGLSPGDGYCPVPYAYVGPWTTRTGDFWNAPFGAARRFDELGSAEAVLEFFTKGQHLAG
jgi:hypothetical protein